MKVICFLLASFVAFFLPKANAEVAEFCNTCVTNNDFKTFAKSLATGQNAGEELYFIMNMQTDQARKVTVSKEPDVGGYLIYAFVSSASSDEMAFYSKVKAAFLGSEYVVPMPPSSAGIGGDSFLLQDRLTVGNQIARQPWMPATLANKTTLSQVIWYAFTKKFRGVPVAIVLFLNGDVAKFKVVNPGAGGAACCEYIPGTARTRDGVFINDQGLGGNGHASGGSYVKQGPTGNVLIQATIYVSCGRVGSGPWTCSVETQSE